METCTTTLINVQYEYIVFGEGIILRDTTIKPISKVIDEKVGISEVVGICVKSTKRLMGDVLQITMRANFWDVSREFAIHLTIILNINRKSGYDMLIDVKSDPIGLYLNLTTPGSCSMSPTISIVVPSLRESWRQLKGATTPTFLYLKVESEIDGSSIAIALYITYQCGNFSPKGMGKGVSITI